VLGSKLIKTVVRAPDMNTYIECFNKSIEEECFDHLVVLSEEHLRDTVIADLRHKGVTLEFWDHALF
jgi:hypothetical protein